MKQQLTFNNWDFTTIWAIDEGQAYPFLRNVLNLPIITATAITDTSIGLIWQEAEEITGYELEVDGNIISLTETRYTHTDLQPNTEHSYRVRAKRENWIGEWSPLLTVKTIAVQLSAPQNVVAQLGRDGVVITWDIIPEAKTYEIEVDGKVVDTVNAATYLHRNPLPNQQHTYRVKAHNTLASSSFSDVAWVISWEEGIPAVSLAQLNWINDLSSTEDIEVIVKANSMAGLYTAQIELQYNPLELTLTPESIKKLILQEDEKGYLATAVDETTGSIKVLVSALAEEPITDGLVDLISLKFKVPQNGSTSLEVKSIKLVNTLGQYIQLPAVNSLDVKVIQDTND
jgi:hypothetical protein